MDLNYYIGHLKNEYDNGLEFRIDDAIEYFKQIKGEYKGDITYLNNIEDLITLREEVRGNKQKCKHYANILYVYLEELMKKDQNLK